MRPTHALYVPDVLSQTALTSTETAKANSGETAVPLTHTGSYSGQYFENLFAEQDDPWAYTTPYEQIKYEQTLSLLPRRRLEKVLELACAEGHFTVQLAPHVGSILATDISPTALERAAQRCAGLDDITFQPLNLIRDPFPGQFDLIICSEVLYYVGDKAGLWQVAQKFANALLPGGYLLTAHAHVVVDEPGHPGFNWDVPFGAKVIGEMIGSEPRLHLVREIRTPLYRVQLFQRIESRVTRLLRRPRITRIKEQPALPPVDSARLISWEGKSSYKAEPVVTQQLPILMYHRVAPTGSTALSRYRVTPERFAQQMAWLHDAGFYTISLARWLEAMWGKRPLSGRAVHITFDDGYRDFLEHAFPVLQRYNFGATVFLVAEQVGKTNRWDSVIYGEEVPLMTWQEVRQLQTAGIHFGSHSATHPALTALTPAQVVEEGLRSRTILEDKLGWPVTTFAYPYGDTNKVVQHLLGACGYTTGVTTWHYFSHFNDSPLALPRVEVAGSDSPAMFRAKLGL